MHHAYLWRSEEAFNPSVWPTYIDEKSSLTRLEFAVVGINEVRQLTREVLLTSLSQAAGRVIVIEADSLTHEAEQAMLKIFEDPRKGVVLVLSLPSGYQLISTLRSRFYELSSAVTAAVDPHFLAFLNSAYQERLETVTDRLAKKDQAWLQAMKRGFLTWLITTNPTADLATYQLIASQLGARGAANKMLLEELALTLRPSKK